jgi:vancomycin resistance protein VanJ
MQSTWRRIPLNLLLASINAYGFSVTVFLLVRWLIGESWGLIALFNSIAHLLFLPAIFLLPLAIMLRRRMTVLLVIPALLAFVLGYGAAFMPRPVQAASDGEALRILTYNLKSLTHNFDPVLAVIREAGADVVALQELSQPMADYLAQALAAEYPHQAMHTTANEPVPGQGVLSRYPIVADDYWRVYLAMQRVTLEVDGQALALYNAHPIMPLSRGGFSRRGEEISDLLARAAGETGAVLLVGDFNMSDQSADYWRVAAQYQDSYREAGWGLGLTFPANMPLFSGSRYIPSVLQNVPPLVRLDYIFHNAAFEALEARVWPVSGGSDHLPVFAALVATAAAAGE